MGGCESERRTELGSPPSHHVQSPPSSRTTVASTLLTRTTRSWCVAFVRRLVPCPASTLTLLPPSQISGFGRKGKAKGCATSLDFAAVLRSIRTLAWRSAGGRLLTSVCPSPLTSPCRPSPPLPPFYVFSDIPGYVSRPNTLVCPAPSLTLVTSPPSTYSVSASRSSRSRASVSLLSGRRRRRSLGRNPLAARPSHSRRRRRLCNDLAVSPWRSGLHSLGARRVAPLRPATAQLLCCVSASELDGVDS